MQKTSLVSGLHKLSLGERCNLFNEFYELSDEGKDKLYNSTLDLATIGENPIGAYELPLRIAPGFKINGRDYIIPLVTEEQSVVAGVANAAKLAHSQGIEAHVKENYAIGQVLLYGVKGVRSLDSETAQLLLDEINNQQKHSRAHKLIARDLADLGIVVDLYFDSADAMGAAKASEMTELIADKLQQYTDSDGYVGRVISNHSGRLTEAAVKLQIDSLGRETKGKDGTIITWSGQEVAQRIELLSKWAYADPIRAATNNKGVMNGVTAVALSTAQDTRAIEAACHSWAARGGAYKPLSRWQISEDGQSLEGAVELLLPVGTVGGEIKRYPKAEAILNGVLKVQSANELAEIMAAVGLMQNYAALSMLSTIGVSKGHGAHR